jgi:predicted nucleic acid-binding protein
LIVVDASAWIDLAMRRESDEVGDLLERDGHWVVPQHFAIESLNALRGIHLGGMLDQLSFARAIKTLADTSFDVRPTEPLIPRIVQLMPDATAYDAAYVALAEELGCTLLASDAKLSRIPGIRCKVVGFE